MDVDGVTVGRTALTEGRWDDARAAFEAAGDRPEAFDGLAEVSYRQGDYDRAIELRERAYAGFRARGETRYPAVLAAYHLAFDYAAVHGNLATAGGWLERGKRLAAVSGDCPERGWVELACVLATEDLDERERHLAAAMDIAVRFGDADLEFDAMAYTGVCLVERGRIDEGMRLLDEAAAAARGGEVQSFTVAGEILCKMLLACELVLDVRRAEQWTSVADHLGRRSDLTWASAICRMHYGAILVAAGRWARAEDELSTSVRVYRGCYRALCSGAVVRLAELRVRQGRLEEAEQLLVGHEHDSYAVRPLARAHLARGELDLAATLLRRHRDQHGDGLPQFPVLALLAEVEVAAGRFDQARELSARLTAIAQSTPLRAIAEFTAGLVGIPEVVTHFETALASFGTAGLPFEEARTRMELARVLAPAGPAVAEAEARAALSVFDRLGAGPDADAAAALLRSLGVRGRTGPKDVGALSKREREVLRLLGLGLSNPEIAARLFISRKTAAHHVSSVLTKLGLRNRAEAAVFAAGQPEE
ncbi:LuxR C-terminal-related transcriptional regulator [Actinokineospora xionganensis]|uniref:Helix-turn-helix transcriptional regulator n=1 Tax=Actinokineospora xionganensis TaxID=2684470 RepID=A0ABR7KZB4_9PSEU|nr:LuxR C-terminal-related transcriptional regulator [Actinokineospora xionganensis]MBC6445692.1 helix-turn-helix transcriptional regulator [Actinokineospora xionganensis]